MGIGYIWTISRPPILGRVVWLGSPRFLFGLIMATSRLRCMVLVFDLAFTLGAGLVISRSTFSAL